MENQTLALIASFIAMTFVVMAYFVKKKAYYLLFELLCIVFLIVSYFFTVQFFAMIGLAVGLFRTVTFFVYENKGRQAPIGWSFLFSGLTIASYFIVNFGILKTSQPLDVLCVVALVMYAFIFRIRDLKTVRFTMLIPLSLSILFNALTNAAFFATLSYTFELCANVVSIFKYHVFNKKPKDLFDFAKTEDVKSFLKDILEDLTISQTPINLLYKDYGFQIDPGGRGAEVWHLGEMVGKYETIEDLFFNFRLDGKPFIERISEIEYE